MAIMTNQYLLDFKGKTATERILEDARKYLHENKSKCLGYKPRPNVVALVHTEDKKEIMGIGGSVPADLLTLNFLEIFRAHHRAPSTVQVVINLTDITNTSFPFNFVWRQFGGTTNNFSGMFNTNAGTPNCQIQVGQGSTVAVRANTNIETPFANGGLEDSRNTISSVGYNLSLKQTKFAVSFGATGSGSISEACLFNNYMKNLTGGRSLKTLLQSRDNISPAVPFIAAQSIFVEYVFQF